MNTSSKVVIVTGASQGIGAGVVKGFRERGWQVVATSRSIQPSSDPDILTIAGDIADPQTAERVVGEAIARFGRIDTLVNNAGIFVAKPFTHYTHADYAQVVATNMSGFSTSPSRRWWKWKNKGAAMSSASPPVWSIMRSTACLRYWRP